MSDPRVVVLRGPKGSWKSSFALGWKSDEYKERDVCTYVFDLELGMHRAKQPGHKIEKWQPPVNLRMQADQLKEMLMFTKGDKLIGKREYWEAIIEEYVHALMRPDVGCIVFDTAKELWTADHQAVLQEKQEAQEADPTQRGKPLRQSLQPVEYAVPNGRFNNVVFMARNFGKDLVLLNHEREKYVLQNVIEDGKVTQKQVPSGEMELDGFKGSGDLADWMFITGRNEEENKPMQGVGANVAWARIEKSPAGDEIVGFQVVPPSYETLQGMLSKMKKGV